MENLRKKISNINWDEVNKFIDECCEEDKRRAMQRKD